MRGVNIISFDGMPTLLGPEPPSNRQRVLIYYVAATLTDLVVLGAFDEYSSSKVQVEGFATLLLAAVAMQMPLHIAIAAEHRWSHYCCSKKGKLWPLLRFLGAWFLLFAGKFVVLATLSFILGDKLRFDGAMRGFVWLILVVAVMLAAEEALLTVYRKLEDPEFDPQEAFSAVGRRYDPPDNGGSCQ